MTTEKAERSDRPTASDPLSDPGTIMHPLADEQRDPQEALARAALVLRRAEYVSVLTGAGVSAESGVATFRGAGGLWEGQRIEDVATPRAFARNPELVWRFYNLRRANLRSVKPNPGHHALARLEQRLGSDRFALITQNVDGLHRSAGSRHLLELHGNLTRVRCTGCGTIEQRPEEDLPSLPVCKDCAALLRPDIVWFEEPLPEETWLEAARCAAQSEVFLVVGTSAVVYPAARLVPIARSAGALVIEVNLERTEATPLVDIGLYGPSGEILPRLVDEE
jgi:NAD-dependent deacetylase